MTAPSVGRIVHYKLTEHDADNIKIRREASHISVAGGYGGAQVRYGNEPREGQVFPLLVTVVWGADLINGQTFLDGNDTHWVMSAGEGDQPGQWSWPPRVG